MEKFLPPSIHLKSKKNWPCQASFLTHLLIAFRWPEIRTGATVDGVVTVVDCEALAAGQFVGDLEALEAQRQEDESLEHETSIEELFADQLACADMVLLTKVDRVDLKTQNRIQQSLAKLA